MYANTMWGLRTIITIQQYCDHPVVLKMKMKDKDHFKITMYIFKYNLVQEPLKAMEGTYAIDLTFSHF